MSTPKIYTSQQFDQGQSIYQCPRCDEHEDVYIQLPCGHKFCIVCMTYSYLKFRGTLQGQNKIKCLNCQNLSELDQQLHQLMCEIISKQLGPIVNNEGQNNESRMSINHTHIDGSNNSRRFGPKTSIKSEDESLVQNGSLTPNKNNKIFYSKCQSPQNSETLNEDSCLIHPTEDISYICMTCNVKLLCYKCIKSNKHESHDVKILKKAIQVLNQKYSLLHLETAQKIQNIELYQKRLYDRKLIFEERIQKSIKQIKLVFASLQRKILQKSNQIIQEYQQFYQSKIQEIQSKAQQSSELLNNIKHFQQMLQNFLDSNEAVLGSKSKSLKPSKTIQKYEEIQCKRKQFFEYTLDTYHFNQKKGNPFQINQNILDPVHYQNSELVKSITKITESIESMSFCNFVHQSQPNERQKFNQTIPYTSIMKSDILFNKNKTMALRNCSSRQKLHKKNTNEQNFAKRIKTNVPASLNTSRDKRDKKHTTKTQEDQRRFKSKANYKTQANTQLKNSCTDKNDKMTNKQIPVPAYITKHLEKHHMAVNGSRKVSPFNNGTVYLMENLHTSKNTSKILSKNSNVLYNDDFNNRKKNKQSFQTEGNKEKKQMIKSAKHSEGVKKKK